MTKLIHWLLPAVCGSWLQALAAGPQRLPLESCLPPDARDLAPSEQLLNFTEAFVQLDQFQTAKGQLVHDAPSRDDQIMLRFVAAGSVASEESGFSEDTGFLSTIVADTGFLNFEAWSNSSALCNSLAQGCPYQAGDVALGLHIPLDSSYAFSSITTKVTILDTSDPSRRLACFRLTATPYYPEYAPYKVILWAPVALTLAYLLVTWIARIWTAYTASMLNREAELAASLTSRLSANGIRERWAPVIWDAASGINLQSSQALRRFATPHARDILWSIQFFAMLAWIAVDWPDFFCACFFMGSQFAIEPDMSMQIPLLGK